MNNMKKVDTIISLPNERYGIGIKQHNDGLCEAIGCIDKATHKIKVLNNIYFACDYHTANCSKIIEVL